MVDSLVPVNSPLDISLEDAVETLAKRAVFARRINGALEKRAQLKSAQPKPNFMSQWLGGENLKRIGIGGLVGAGLGGVGGGLLSLGRPEEERHTLRDALTGALAGGALGAGGTALYNLPSALGKDPATLGREAKTKAETAVATTAATTAAREKALRDMQVIRENPIFQTLDKLQANVNLPLTAGTSAAAAAFHFGREPVTQTRLGISKLVSEGGKHPVLKDPDILNLAKVQSSGALRKAMGAIAKKPGGREMLRVIQAEGRLTPRYSWWRRGFRGGGLGAAALSPAIAELYLRRKIEHAAEALRRSGVERPQQIVGGLLKQP